MLLAHRIRIDANAAQPAYFARAAGTTRRFRNRVLAEWRRQAALGRKPDSLAFHKQFNAIKSQDPAWLDADGNAWPRTIHRDARAALRQPVRAWRR